MRLQGSLVKETTSTTGQGTKTLLGGAAPYYSFVSVLAAGEECTYVVRDSANSELILGTFQTGPDRLTVDTVLKSTNGGLAVDWGVGTRDIYMVSAPEDEPETLLEVIEVGVGGAATVSFTGLTDDYDEYVLRFLNVKPESDNVIFQLRLSEAGVFKSGGSDYRYAGITSNDSASHAPFGSTGAAQIRLGGSVGNATGEGLHGELVLSRPASSGAAVPNHQTRSYLGGITAGGNTFQETVVGTRANATPVAQDGIRFLFDSGDVAVGSVFLLYGRRGKAWQ